MTSTVVLVDVRGHDYMDIWYNAREQARQFFGLSDYEIGQLEMPVQGLNAHQDGDSFIVPRIVVEWNVSGPVGSMPVKSEKVVQSYSDRPEVQHVTTPHGCSCEDYRYRKLGTSLTCKHQRDEFGFGQHNALIFPQEFLAELRNSRKISAIKILRDTNRGMSLKEAKDHTDAYAANGDLT